MPVTQITQIKTSLWLQTEITPVIAMKDTKILWPCIGGMVFAPLTESVSISVFCGLNASDFRIAFNAFWELLYLPPNYSVSVGQMKPDQTCRYLLVSMLMHT